MKIANHLGPKFISNVRPKNPWIQLFEVFPGFQYKVYIFWIKREGYGLGWVFSVHPKEKKMKNVYKNVFFISFLPFTEKVDRLWET